MRRVINPFLLAMKLVCDVVIAFKNLMITFMPPVNIVTLTPRSSWKTRTYTRDARAIVVGAEFDHLDILQKIVITKSTPRIKKLSE